MASRPIGPTEPAAATVSPAVAIQCPLGTQSAAGVGRRCSLGSSRLAFLRRHVFLIPPPPPPILVYFSVSLSLSFSPSLSVVHNLFKFFFIHAVCCLTIVLYITSFDEFLHRKEFNTYSGFHFFFTQDFEKSPLNPPKETLTFKKEFFWQTTSGSLPAGLIHSEPRVL